MEDSCIASLKSQAKPAQRVYVRVVQTSQQTMREYKKALIRRIKENRQRNSGASNRLSYANNY